MYSKTVLDHFRNPRNVGVIEDADGVGEVGNPLCGDIMTIYLTVKNEHIESLAAYHIAKTDIERFISNQNQTVNFSESEE